MNKALYRDVLPHYLRGELWWFGLGLALAIMVGVIADAALMLPMIFLWVYVLWLLWRISSIVRWLHAGALGESAPPTVGMMNQIVELIHREKKYSRKQKNRYRSALAQFNKLAAELPDATVVLDEQLQIRWANSAAQSLLKISQERDRGQRIDNLIRHPEFHHFLGNDDPQAELELAAPASNQVMIAIRLVPSGNKMSVLIARDITQGVRLREMRKAFVADVSHELRSPLTVIQGHLEMLLEETEQSTETHRSLLSASTQTDRMRHIVDHLLELSKLEGNPLAENAGDTINMAALIQSIVSVAQSDSAQNKHRFSMDLDHTLYLLGSENEIHSACSNLVFNAINYAGEAAAITVTWALSNDGHPLFSVQDDGPGIEPRHLPRLSERFYRVDKSRSRSQGGTGLGLAIVKHAAQRHQGQLLISSTPGRGSLFSIEFPPNRAAKSRTAIN